MHVGNDIVDLASPYVKGKSRDRKFRSRVLTAREHHVLFDNNNPDRLLQVFWAAKETAYKVTVKTHPDVSSAPRRYEVLLDRPESGSNVRGRVETPRGIVHITARQNPDYVHCLGTETAPAARNVISGVEALDDLSQPDFGRCSDAQSRLVRAAAQKRISAILSLPENDIAITKTCPKKSTLFPEVYVKGKKCGINISLSHDGRFIAYAFWIQGKTPK